MREHELKEDFIDKNNEINDEIKNEEKKLKLET